MRRSAPLSLALAATLLALLAAPSASAQESQRTFPGFRLEPAVDVEGIGNTEWGEVPEHMQWDAALWLGYENDPLYLFTPVDGQNPFERTDVLVQNRIHGNVVLALGLVDWLQVGLDMPLLLAQSRDESIAPEVDAGGGAISSLGIGDINVATKVRVLRQKDGAPFDLAFVAPFSLPSGQTTDYFGEEGMTFSPGVAASREVGDVRLAANLQHRFRDEVSSYGLALGNELIARVAAAYRFTVVPENPTEIGASLMFASATSSLFRGDNAITRNPVELMGDVQHKVWGPIDAFFGGAAGLVSNYGVPDYRVFAGVRFSERPPADYDHDGIRGSADRCPHEPENKNGVQDEDGCPDGDDTDKDGIVDTADACKDVPEDKDGVEDHDGCPEDNDKDGIADDKDACKDVPEDKDGFEDEDGCPEDDNDKDGIKDADDKCKDTPEDKDGFVDEDGCPDDDNDGDGLADASDQCPNEPGPKTNKGCPDKDRDGDTVVDRLDNCPDEPGPPENGGCAKKQLVVLTDAKIEIKDKVYFKTNSDVIEKKSYALLDNVAAVLQAHPELAKIRVEGHTDNVGDAAYNKDLSGRRAASVKKYLAGKGIPEARLDSAGFGMERPVAPNDNEQGRSQNRRVEFLIVE